MDVSIHRRRTGDDDESVFVPVTDLMISLLFIVILLMAFFALQVRSTEETVPKTLYDRETEIRDAKIKELKEEIELLMSVITTLKQEKAELASAAKRQQRRIEELGFLVKRQKKRIEELEAKLRDPLDEYLAGIKKRRTELMLLIKKSIESKRTIRVTVDEHHGIIRFNNKDLFASGEWRVSNQARLTMEVIADAIYSTLPCFTLGASSNFSGSCNPEFAIIDAIQIEGHTDNKPVASNRSDYIFDNLELSARRATETYRAMVRHKPALKEFLNAEAPPQPVLSVSGYGETRPIEDNATADGRELNRRIDLRFIMMTPESAKEVENFKRRLEERAEQYGRNP